MSFYTISELEQLGLKKYGNNVLISRYARIYNPGNISIGNNVRIDDFCILSSGTEPFILEDYIHISAGVYIYGQNGFHMKSFSNVSSGTKIFTQSDTFDGDFLIGPMVPLEHRNVYGSSLIIEKHVIIGTSSVILPEAVIEEGVVIGANSLVKTHCKAWSIYAGSPIKYIKMRSKEIVEKEKMILSMQ
jgi:acetyltransferase-like isoleucine patch superfamily enzyme